MSCNHPNVLLVAFHYPPEISAGVRRAEILEEFLVRRGCQVTLLTPQQITQGRHGARVLHVPLPWYLRRTCGVGAQPVRRPSLWRTFVRRWILAPDVVVGWAMLAARAAVRANAASPFDLVITSSPPESMHWIGWRLSRKGGCRWLADFRDGWLLEPIRPEVNLFGRHWLEGRMEAAVVRRADWITANTRTVAEDFARRYPDKEPCIHALPTGFLPGDFHTAQRDDNSFRLVYTGGFTRSFQRVLPTHFFQGLRLALESDPGFAAQFRLLLAGGFTEGERALWQNSPLAQVVEERGPAPYEQAMQMAASATMLLLVIPPGVRSVVPRKLFDYLAARRPVLAVSDENEATEILRETEAGISAPSSRPSQIAETLLRAFQWWRAGQLDEKIPCRQNDLYRSDVHFSRVLGDVVLREMGHCPCGQLQGAKQA